MNRPCAGVLFALVAIGVFAGDPDPAAARKAVEEGDAARAKGDLAGAIEAYGRAVDADPASPVAWHHRGLARRQAGKLDEAIADLEKAVELDPSAAGPHNDLGLAKADAGDLAGAIASYDTALRLAPDSALTWNNRSFARRLTGDVDGALKDATMALQLDPKYARAYLNRGLCLYDHREWEDALADLEQSESLQPSGQVFSRFRIWILRTRLGNRETADQGLLIYLKWLPVTKDGDDWTELQARFLLGKASEKDLLEKAADADPKKDRLRKSEAWFLVGSRALVTGDGEAAKRAFQSALDTGVKNTEVIRSAEAELEPLKSLPPK